MKAEASLRSVADAVARELSVAFSEGSETFIRTPLLYADGSSVVVHLSPGHDDFFISDGGFGARAAHLGGADYWFKKFGETQAALAGVNFDSQTFFTLRVSRGQLPLAVATIANASKTTLDISLLKLSEHRHVEDERAMARRLSSVFGADRVATEVEIAGASNHRWRVDALVLVDERQIVFDLVKPVPQSVFPAVAKFVDLSDLSRGYQNVAVLDSRPAEIELVNLLSRSARVINSNDTDDVYRRAA